MLEDPAVLGVSAMAKPGETAPRAIARLESFVAETMPQYAVPPETVMAIWFR